MSFSAAGDAASTSSPRRRRAASAFETRLPRTLRPKNTGEMLWHQYPFCIVSFHCRPWFGRHRSGNTNKVVQTKLSSERTSTKWACSRRGGSEENRGEGRHKK